MKNAALRWLDCDPLLHICMTECIRRGHAEVLAAEADGVMIRDVTDSLLHVSTLSPDRLRSWLPVLAQSGETITLHQDFGPDIAASALPGYTGRMHCYHSAYTKKEPLPLVLPEGAHIAPLERRHLEQTAREYGHASAEYVAGRIDAGVMIGIFFGDRMAGFIGEHTEGAQGLLHILPEYRRMGLATALMAANINAALQRGQVPFGQIETHNQASIALSRSMGLEISTGVVHWLFKE